MDNTPQQARFFKDLHIVQHGKIQTKEAAVLHGVDPDNFDKIKGGLNWDDLPAEQKAKYEIAMAYEHLIDFMHEWIDIPEDYYKIVAIWIIGTYFHKSFSTYPFLYFNAIKGSGKTRTLKIVSWLQSKGNGDVITNPSEAVLFRTAKERGLILDEMESERSKEKQTMREILNACYKTGGKVQRMKKKKTKDEEEQVVEDHYLYTPVALANINGIDDVLSDRSISLILEKSINPYLVKKVEDFDTNEDIKEIKRTLDKFSVQLCSVYPIKKCIKGWNDFIKDKYTSIHHINSIHNYSYTIHKEKEEIDTDMEEFYNKIDQTGIFGRNLELFLPLLLTAKMISNTIFEDILIIIKKLNESKKDDEFTENKDVSLIEFISKSERYRFEYVHTKKLHEEFKAYAGSTLDDSDSWNTVTWFGLALKRLKLLSDRKRVATGILLMIDIDKAKSKLKLYKNEEEIK